MFNGFSSSGEVVLFSHISSGYASNYKTNDPVIC